MCVARNSWIGSFGFLQIAEGARPGRAGLAAGGGQPLGDPVIAEGALVHRVRARVDEAAAVGAGLHAVAAAQAVGLVHQDDAVRALEGRAHRADLDAGRVGAVVAELRDEEVLGAVARAGTSPGSRRSRRWASRPRDGPPPRDAPCPSAGRGSARPRCGSRTARAERRSRVLQARTQLPQPMHFSMSMIMAHQCSAISYSGAALAFPARTLSRVGPPGRGQEDEPGAALQEFSTVDLHRSFSYSDLPGGAAGGSSVQSSSPGVLLASTCGNAAGRRDVAARDRSGRASSASGRAGLTAVGSSACAGQGAVAGLAVHLLVLAPLPRLDDVGVAFLAGGPPGEGRPAAPDCRPAPRAGSARTRRSPSGPAISRTTRKRTRPSAEENRGADEMLDVLESALHESPLWLGALCALFL